MNDINAESGKQIAEAIDKRITSVAKQLFNNAERDKTVYGIVLKSNAGVFSVKVNNQNYDNIIALRNVGDISVGEKVTCLVPNGNYSDMIILGVADGSIQSGGGSGGEVYDGQLTIQRNGTTVGTFTANSQIDKLINILVPTTAQDVGALPDSTLYTVALSFSYNSNDYTLTVQLKDQNGNNIGSAGIVTLPLTNMVIDGSYDSNTKSLILEQLDGTTESISLAGLISGLQPEITSANKLSADLVDDSTTTNKFVSTGDISNWNSKQNAITSSNKLSSDLVDDTNQTNKFVTATEKNTWNGKQDALSSSQLTAVNSGITSSLVTQIGTNQTNISGIESKIPTQASSTNQLADKDFVNSSINALAAFYITRTAQGDNFNTYSQLSSATTFYSGGQVRVPTQNDYTYVRWDETKGTQVSGYSSFTTTAQYIGYYVIYNNEGIEVDSSNKDSVGIVAGTTVAYENLPTTRYSYQGGTYPNGQWDFQLIVNNSALNAAQMAALNSGITSTLVGQITTNQTNIGNKMDKAEPTGTGALSINRAANTTIGTNSVAVGTNNTASGGSSFSEGQNNTSSGLMSHSEGWHTTASGGRSHAEGLYTTASGTSSHSEGSGTVASGEASHAEGYREGTGSGATGNYSHSEGIETSSTGNASHAEGNTTLADGAFSHAEGSHTIAQRRSQHVFGEYNVIDSQGDNSGSRGQFVEIVGNGADSSNPSNARTLDWSGNEVLAGNLRAAGLTDGTTTKTMTEILAGGGSTITVDSALSTTSENPVQNKVITNALSDKMDKTNPVGTGTFSMNRLANSTIGTNSFTEGIDGTASGNYSHAEGSNTIASGSCSHAEGGVTTASGNYSHAEGLGTVASGNFSHAGGWNTTAQRKSQYVFGEYNVLDTSGTTSDRGSYVEIVGNGTSSNSRSNARTLDWNGNQVLAGWLTMGSNSYKAIAYDPSAVSTTEATLLDNYYTKSQINAQNEKTIERRVCDYNHSLTVGTTATKLVFSDGSNSVSFLSHGGRCKISGGIFMQQQDGGNHYVALYIDGQVVENPLMTSSTRYNSFHGLDYITTPLSAGTHTFEFYIFTNVYTCVVNASSQSQIIFEEIR